MQEKQDDFLLLGLYYSEFQKRKERHIFSHQKLGSDDQVSKVFDFQSKDFEWK